MQAILLFTILFLQTAGRTQTGSVAGELRAKDSSPAAGVRVTAREAPLPNATSKDPVFARITQTDAKGHYKLEDIPPGRHFITAGSLDFPTYYPGVSSTKEAEIIEVRAGAAIADKNFTVIGLSEFRLLLTRSPDGRVSGRLKGLSEDTLADLRVVMMLANPPNGPLKIRVALIKPDGTFEFTSIPRGNYALRVVRSRVADTIDVPYAPVVLTFEVIDADMPSLEVAVAPGDVR